MDLAASQAAFFIPDSFAIEQARCSINSTVKTTSSKFNDVAKRLLQDCASTSFTLLETRIGK
jgi:hypothetical protein